MPRKLTTILSLDAVGYSALIAADETLTLKRLRRDREEIIDPLVARHGGRVFNGSAMVVWLNLPAVCTENYVRE